MKNPSAPALLRQLREKCLVLAGLTALTLGMTHWVKAQEIPQTPISITQAPYSQVFLTGKDFAVKDRDYDPSNGDFGFSDLWSYDPEHTALAVNVYYCLSPSDGPIIPANSELTQVLLLQNNQPLVNIDRVARVTPSRVEVEQSGYYTYDYAGRYWGTRPMWNTVAASSASTCMAGASRFDITPLAQKLSQLPDQTLRVRLVFNDGSTRDQELGAGTVQAVKELITLYQGNTPIPAA